MARGDVRRAYNEAVAIGPVTHERSISDVFGIAAPENSLASAPDDYPVRMHVGTRMPAAISVRGPEDFHDILQELQERYGVVTDTALQLEIFQHETEHTQCTALVDDRRVFKPTGPLAVRQSIHLAMTPQERVIVAGHTVRTNTITTKLGAAITLLYPQSAGGPSEVDVDGARYAYGHTMDSVVEAVNRHNEPYEPGDPRRLPLPLTRSGKTP